MLTDRLSQLKAPRIILASLLCICCGCADNAQPEPTADPDADPSETALANFTNKLNEGNYVIDQADFLKTTVYSPDLVYFDYADDMYDDDALITINNETFHGILADNEVTDVEYLANVNALTAAAGRLPNCWEEIAEGNMFNLFYGSSEKPLEFVTSDNNVKMTLMGLAGYGMAALSLMQDVTMTLDAENPSSVRFTAVVEDDPVARIFFDDLDLTIKFGEAKSDARIDSWIKNPVYPAARTAWTEDDLFYLNSVFMTGYADMAVPFPEFASYAMKIDDDVFAESESIYLSDAHATEADLQNYINVLKQNGFAEMEENPEEGDNTTVYRKLLREDYKSYSSVYPHMDNGVFVIEARRWYDSPSYSSLADINTVLTESGFAAIGEDTGFTNWRAKDTRGERAESWLYFFEYDMSLIVKADYEDADAVDKFVEEYGKKLEEMGFHLETNYDGEQDVFDRYTTRTGASVFRIPANDGSTVTFEFRNDKAISAAQAVTMIGNAGIPEPPLAGDVTCRDISKYHKNVRDFKGALYLTVSQLFDDAEEGEKFLDDYVQKLEEAGYYRENPDNVGTLKQNAYYNEEEDKFVAFDFYPDNSIPAINIDFVSNR